MAYIPLPIGGIVIGYIYMNYGKVLLNNTLHDAAEVNNLVIEGVQGNKKVLRRMGPIVYLGTFITVIFGGSTGREGAAVQMGGSVAEAVNKFFKISILDTKILIMSGISAGFGAAFGAPITGAIFGMEMANIGKLKFEGLVPCLVASFVGHFMTTAAWGHKHEEFIIKNQEKPYEKSLCWWNYHCSINSNSRFTRLQWSRLRYVRTIF
jgi:H+/Cl- antiporter ClcA